MQPLFHVFCLAVPIHSSRSFVGDNETVYAYVVIENMGNRPSYRATLCIRHIHGDDIYIMLMENMY